MTYEITGPTGTVRVTIARVGATWRMWHGDDSCEHRTKTEAMDCARDMVGGRPASCRRV